jgi:glutamyl-tRNA synthetase
MNNRKVRTRIAPSPTGFATVGNLRTALFNYLFAKKHGGEFVIRIEDTDETRFVEGAEKYIIDSLEWLGIKPDIGIKSDGTAEFRQSEREYRSYADLLISNGHAYYAFDTSEELYAMKANGSGVKTGYNSISRMSMKNSFTMSEEEVKKRIDSGDSYVIRFNMPCDKTVTFKDSVKGNITFDSNTLDDKVLFKSSGMVAYHLANVVDDYRMQITHVIRGDEWVSSTPLHIMIYEAFGWEKPEFCHVPLVLGPDGKKLSKRKMKEYGFTVFPLSCSYVDDNGKTISVTGFKDENYEPDALINFLALIGWNPGGDKEFMSMDEMIDLFSLDRINNSGGMFDIEKLKNFNAHYLRNNRSSSDLFVRNIMPHLKNNFKIYSNNEIDKIVKIASNRSVFRKDLYKSVSYFFEPVVLSDDVVLKNESEFRNVMTLFLFNPCNRVIWTEYEIEKVLKNLCENIYNIKIGKVLPDLRLALTGGLPGPELPLVMLILGPQESCNRIDDLLLKTKKVAS